MDTSYYAATEIILKNDQNSDVFTDVDYFIVNTNYGVMVLFFNESGSIHKLELNFRVEKKMPPFLQDLIFHFPGKTKKVSRIIIDEISKIGVLPINSYLLGFRRKKLITVVLD